MLNIPDRALYNRQIPKNKFYAQIGANTKLKRKFINEIEQIIWKYKLSKDTVNLEPVKGVEEIQIFEIILKQKYISIDVLENIDRVIPYPILFILRWDSSIKIVIAYKERNKIDPNKMIVKSYYQTEWMKENQIQIDVLHGLNLKDVYDNILKQLIPIESTFQDNIEELIKLDKEQEKLKRYISRLESKMKKEKQFDRKVKLNIELKKKKKELEKLVGK
ncbi:DUF4391 domain-containing protein [Clostridium sp. cel8]|jgi:hypothetical protein|uniref:DUF4391 domain-containing protein n=1 Tax=unclassified Clostridium TaxID=2614128 RepID=UPI0015F6DA16|nr:DUF4391 domain-containing protein [Clostridium sp. cel8]MBA5849763.1 DUF4391 domain-containing protein [Clostridium sp. cel8]